MMKSEILIHSFHILAAVLLFYATFSAIKKFKLVIWKRGWHLIGLGAFFVILEHVWIFFAEDAPFFHIFDIIAISCIAFGVFLLSKSATKIWGK